MGDPTHFNPFVPFYPNTTVDGFPGFGYMQMPYNPWLPFPYVPFHPVMEYGHIPSDISQDVGEQGVNQNSESCLCICTGDISEKEAVVQCNNCQNLFHHRCMLLLPRDVSEMRFNKINWIRSNKWKNGIALTVIFRLCGKPTPHRIGFHFQRAGKWIG